MGGLAFDSIPYPIVVAPVPMPIPIDHNARTYFVLIPLDFKSFVEARPSGKLETKIATRRAMFIAPPVARVIPRAAFSGILSIRDPINNDRPDTDFPPPPFSPRDLSTSVISDF